MDTAKFNNLIIIERLRVMDALWDSLLYEKIEIESPEWHEKILEDRKIKIKENNAKFISLSELKASRKKRLLLSTGFYFYRKLGRELVSVQDAVL
ncbi:MAG: addiction module protein [Desulfobacterales bacterium]